MINTMPYNREYQQMMVLHIASQATAVVVSIKS